MKINKIEITSFGKFKNKTINLKNGINIISGENESGKSTVISFIFAMFYGFGESRGKSLSLREKYTPWDGGVCEGKLSLTTDDGENITIYRKAGSAKKYDTLMVYDTNTANELSVSPLELIGIGSDTFLKTLCIKQLACVTDGGNEEMLGKLSNIASTADENISYEKARKILENSRREISPKRGDGGKLSEITKRISEAEHKRAMESQVKSQLTNAQALLKNTKEELKGLYDRFEKASLTVPDESKKTFKDKSKKRVTAGILISALLSVVLSFLLSLSGIRYPFEIGLVCFIILFIMLSGKKNTYSQTAVQNEESEAHLHALKTLQREILEKEKNALSIESQIRSLEQGIGEESESDLNELYREKASLEKKLNALTLACAALDNAAQRMKNNFTPSINKNASKYFETLSGEKYNGLFCGEDFSLKVNADIPRSSEYFSGGCVDQMYLSLRLALTDMLFKDKTIFMLLDQPFLQYDEKRKKNAMGLLDSLGEKRQIILFENDVERFSPNKNIEILT